MNEQAGGMGHHQKLVLNQAIHVMLADGKIDPGEMRFLEGLRIRFGMSKDDLQKLLDHGESTPASSTPPDMIAICLADCLRMTVADGEVTETELRACRHLALAMGLDEELAAKSVELGRHEAIAGRDPLPKLMTLVKNK